MTAMMIDAPRGDPRTARLLRLDPATALAAGDLAWLDDIGMRTDDPTVGNFVFGQRRRRKAASPN